MKRHTKLILTLLACGALLHHMPATAQDIAEIAKSDPLIVTGSIGTRNTFYHSSVGGSAYRSPMSNSFFANLNIGLYGYSMPFSFYYTRSNSSFSYPHLTFNINPHYKNWTGYFGQSSMPFSSYILGMPFEGIGLEYGGEKFRGGVFYGQLMRAINDDPTDPSPRKPQYSRLAVGLKAGYGSGSNYIDVYALRAWDSKSSLNPTWREQVSPQESFAVGIKAAVAPFSWLSLNTNVGATVTTANTEAPAINTDDTKEIDNIITARYSSRLRLAGDVSANLHFNSFSSSIFYRIVEPDYNTLGTYHMTSNYQSLGISANTMLFRKLSLSAMFSAQSDNLTNRQIYTTSGYVASANAAANLGKHFSLSLAYNGYFQDQSDGTMKVDEKTRVKRTTQSLTFAPNYNFETTDFTHSFSLSGSYTENKDLNKFSDGQTDCTALAGGLNYTIGVKAWEMDFSTSLNRQQSKGYNMKYTSDILSLTTSRSFLKEKNLSLSASLNLIYNEVERQSKSASMGVDLSAGYTLKKVHAFSATFSANRYGDVNSTNTYSKIDDVDLNASLNYTYTFSLFEIKSKANKKANK